LWKMPVKTQWDRAARAFLIIANQRPCGPSTSRSNRHIGSHQHNTIDPKFDSV
jgi:hypothetical protein